MADLNITSVTGPGVIAQNAPFFIDVNTTALAEDFDEGVTYKLLVFVTSLLTGSLLVPPIITTGSLQDSSWPAAANLFHIPVNAGPAFDVYTILAVLLEGPTGAGGVSFSSGGPLVVV